MLFFVLHFVSFYKYDCLVAILTLSMVFCLSPTVFTFSECHVSFQIGLLLGCDVWTT